MTLEDALKAFLLQLQADGRSSHTWKQYERHIRLFTDWFEREHGRNGLDEIRHGDLAQFFANSTTRIREDGQPRSPATLNALRTSLRCFFDYCHGAEWSSHNPARLLRRAVTPQRAPRPVGKRDQELLLKAADEPASLEGERDLMLIRLLLGAGIRIGSAIALDLEDVDLEAAELRLRTRKGGGQGVAVLPERTVAALRKYMADRTSGPLFCDRRGRRISIRQAQRRFTEILAKAGIAGKHSLHALRHSFGTELYAKTGDIHLVQTAMGHRSVESTLVYARCDRDRLRRVL